MLSKNTEYDRYFFFFAPIQMKKHPQTVSDSRIIIASNIPATRNAITSVFGYFKKYGHIRSLWVGGTEAIIEYDSPQSAQKAYDDPESFLNNRFIKIGFHHQNFHESTNLLQHCNEDMIENLSNSANERVKSIMENTENIKRQISEQKLLEAVVNSPFKKSLDNLLKKKAHYLFELNRIQADNNGNEEETASKKQSIIKKIAKLQMRIDKRQKASNDSNHLDGIVE